MQINTNKEKMTINTICYYFQEKNMSFYRCFLIFLGQRLSMPSKIGVIPVPIFFHPHATLRRSKKSTTCSIKKKKNNNNLLNDK